MGLLNADALKNVSAFSEFDVSKENSDPGGDMSLGRYLQPAQGDAAEEEEDSVCSQPLSDSEEEQELPLNPQQVAFMTLNLDLESFIISLQAEQPEEDSFQFLAPTPLSNPMAPPPQFPPQNLESSVSFVSWDNVAQANKEEEQFSPASDQVNSMVWMLSFSGFSIFFLIFFVHLEPSPG